MMPPIALDLTRLALAPVRRAPRGIDRVELAYAHHFLEAWPGECVPVLPMPWGVRCYTRSQAIKFIAAIEELWRETADPSQDPVYARTKSLLSPSQIGATDAAPSLKPTTLEQAAGFLRLLSRTGILIGRAAVRAIPHGAIYLNVGQLEVYRPFLTWLHRRPDVRAIFMIHDLIPLQLPQHHLPIGIRLHERIVKNTAEFAKAIIVPSEAVADTVRSALSQSGRDDAPIHVEHLAVGPEFLRPTSKDTNLTGLNYFVICGAIDSYKNHLLLLKVWKRLLNRHGQTTPKLLIAGSPGVTAEAVLAFIKNCPELQPHVVLASGLSTCALRQLMIGAKALLMPSLAEGFGLPIIEALAQGTPVIASDIPAHREAGKGGQVTFLDANSEDEWLREVEQMGGSRLSGPYAPKTWDDYFRGLASFLTSSDEAGHSR